MKSIKSQLLLMKFNNINKSVFIPLMAICLIFYSTAVNKMLGGIMETAQNVLAIGIFAIIGLNIFFFVKEDWKTYIKTNLIVIIYFFIRLITLFSVGFQYSAIRSVFFEVFFLLGICTFTSGDKKNIYKLISLFLYFELILSVLSVAIYFIVPILGEQVINAFVENTMYQKFPMAALFVNQNTAGIMSAFALIFLYSFYEKERVKKRKIIIGLLIIYQLLFLYFQHCRSAEVAILVVIGIVIFRKIFKTISTKKIVATICVLCMLCIAGIYALEIHSINDNPYVLSESEEVLNDLLSNRISIWKGCIIEQKSHPLLGAGSLALEQDNRKAILIDLDIDQRYGWRMCQSSKLGPHNGYIGMISATGWLGFLAFMAALYSKIKKSKLIEEGNWYLLIIFTLIVNLFESLFILNRFFLCFYMFMILEADNDKEEGFLTDDMEVSK